MVSITLTPKMATVLIMSTMVIQLRFTKGDCDGNATIEVNVPLYNACSTWCKRYNVDGRYHE